MWQGRLGCHAASISYSQPVLTVAKALRAVSSTCRLLNDVVPSVLGGKSCTVNFFCDNESRQTA